MDFIKNSACIRLRDHNLLDPYFLFYYNCFLLEVVISYSFKLIYAFILIFQFHLINLNLIYIAYHYEPLFYSAINTFYFHHLKQVSTNDDDFIRVNYHLLIHLFIQFFNYANHIMALNIFIKMFIINFLVMEAHMGEGLFIYFIIINNSKLIHIFFNLMIVKDGVSNLKVNYFLVIYYQKNDEVNLVYWDYLKYIQLVLILFISSLVHENNFNGLFLHLQLKERYLNVIDSFLKHLFLFIQLVRNIYSSIPSHLIHFNCFY